MEPENDPFLVEIPGINDSLIMQRDPTTGEDLMAFHTKINGKDIYFKPVLAIYWAAFEDGLRKIVEALDKYKPPMGNPAKPEEIKINQFAALVGAFGEQPATAFDNVGLFLDYMRPHRARGGVLPKISSRFERVKLTRRWFNRNMGIDELARLLIIMANVDILVKKNMTSTIRQAHPQLSANSPLQKPSPNSPATQPTSKGTIQFSKLGSSSEKGLKSQRARKKSETPTEKKPV